VECSVTLKAGSRRIDVEMVLDNQADDHRVRVLIPTPYVSETCLSDNQFGVITRSVNDAEMENWEKDGWKEAPVPVWQLMNFAALEDSKQGMAVFTNGLREFEVISSKGNDEKDTIALTLFRSIGVLGKEELLLRPGRPSGIKVPTPDSQMRGKLVCRFGLFGFKGDHITANVMQNARDYVTPIHSYNKIPYNAMKLNVGEQNLPMTYSLLEKDMRGAVLSVLKKAEDEDALILRVYNPSETETITDAVHFNRPVTEWIETQMDEVVLTDSTPANSQFGELGQCQAKTFRVRF
jgi:mannosylglycerate hydrolase